MPAASIFFPFIHYHCFTAADPPASPCDVCWRLQSVTQNARDGSLRRGLEQPRPRMCRVNADHEALLQEAKANRARLFGGGEGGGVPTDDEAEPDPEPGPEADMDDPDDEEPTAAEYGECFNSIMAM